MLYLNSLNRKLKKNLFFFDNIDYYKALSFKKIKVQVLLLLSQSLNTIETISNFLFLNKIKKIKKI